MGADPTRLTRLSDTIASEEPGPLASLHHLTHLPTHFITSVEARAQIFPRHVNNLTSSCHCHCHSLETCTLAEP
jgi:hypothetical protein